MLFINLDFIIGKESLLIAVVIYFDKDFSCLFVQCVTTFVISQIVEVAVVNPNKFNTHSSF